MGERHDPYGPSRLAMWENCCHWESAGESDAAAEGTLIHRLIAESANGMQPEMSSDRAAIVNRALDFARSIYDGQWSHEQWIDGAIKETGGTLDAWCRDADRLVIIDWKGGDVPADSMQGKAYALNLWTDRPCAGMVAVYFYNYNTGSVQSAEYTNINTLHADVSACKAARIERKLPPSRFYGCAYCAKLSTCKACQESTMSELSVPMKTEMTLAEQVQAYEKLKALLKIAEEMESKLNDAISEQVKEGADCGYKIVSKGAARRWTKPVGDAINKYVMDNWLDDPDVYSAATPAALEKLLKSAWGESHTDFIDKLISSCTAQDTYDTLVKITKKEKTK